MKFLGSIYQSSNLALFLLISGLLIFLNIECAPALSSKGSNMKNNNGNGNGNRLVRTGLLSNLFRRQINSSSGEASTTESSNSIDTDEPQTQTEADAQKFIESLPNVVST